MAKSPYRKWLLLGFKAIVTGTLIWIILENVNLSETRDHLAQASFAMVAAVLALVAIQSLVASARWLMLMRLFGPALPYRTAVRLYFEGLFFNQALPSTVGGDAVRMYRAIKLGLPLSAGINGVLLDRIVGLLGLLLVVLATQPLLYQRIDDPATRIAFAVLLALGGLAAILLFSIASVPDRYRRWAIVRGVTQLSGAFRTMVHRPAIGASVLAVSILGHVIIVSAIYAIVQGLDVEVGFADCLMLVPAVMLFATVPISIAGWGVREGAMVAAFALVGASESGAVAVSFLFGLTMIVIGLPGGLLWYKNPDHRVVDMGDLEQMAEEGAGNP